MKSALFVCCMHIVTICLTACVSKESTTSMRDKSIMEVTTFKIADDTYASVFATLDQKVENDFTSKQKGFVSRQSALDDKGNYAVVVFWESMADAEQSMSKFMTDPSVADYAKMIDASTMRMSRYGMNQQYQGGDSRFVEIMSFDLKAGTDKSAFSTINDKVAKEVTAPKPGFIQRLTGSDENGKQVVAVYWDSKLNSNAALQPFMDDPLSQQFMGMMEQSSIQMGRYKFLNMELTKKEKVVALLNSFNTGDQAPIAYINPNKYIQHNLDVADGLAGFGAVMQHAPPGGFKAKIIRAFEDGDYVFTHTEYDFFGPKAGFDVFRFEDGQIVEHWDNLLEVQAPNPSGHTQFDGATDISDKDKTAVNRKLVSDFLQDVLLDGQMNKLTSYINPQKYIQHNPAVADGLDGFGEAMKYFAANGLVMEYDKVHKVLGEGNFVLSLSEGKFGKGEHTAFYDLFRIEDGLIVEHWDVIAPIPAKSDWKNENGKF